MLVNPEKKETILACHQEPKDKIKLGLREDGKVRVEIRTLLSEGVGMFDDNFVELDFDDLEQAIRELKEMR